jgi:hypothetical protein
LAQQGQERAAKKKFFHSGYIYFGYVENTGLKEGGRAFYGTKDNTCLPGAESLFRRFAPNYILREGSFSGFREAKS